MTFDELADIILPLFHVSIQDFIEKKTAKNSCKTYELLLKYENRQISDPGGELVNPRQRGTRSNQFNLFSPEVRDKENGKGFRGSLESLHMGTMMVI